MDMFAGNMKILNVRIWILSICDFSNLRVSNIMTSDISEFYKTANCMPAEYLTEY